MSSDAFFQMPPAGVFPLEVAPRLASWMERGHPDQVRLTNFLDHAEEVLSSQIVELDDQLAIRLDVGIPAGVDHLRHHDLDNYLFPLVQRLGAHRFDCAWATKAPGDQSFIQIEKSVRCQAPDHIFKIKTTASAETRAWKEEVRSQLARAAELPPGPVEVQLSFAVGPSRNWANLWKQAIDSLEPLLGQTEPGREWNPHDGRISTLGLHKSVNPRLRYEVEITVAARATSPGERLP